MIKKCKITNLVNGIIYGVTKEPIRNNTVTNLNSGQILHCLLESNVDEILSDGTLVRLNKSNYNKNNESKKVYLADETKQLEDKPDETKQLEDNKDEQKQEEDKPDETKQLEDNKDEQKQEDKQKINNLKKRK